MTALRRPILTLDDPLARDAERSNRGPANSYEGATSRQMNVRVLVPLHDRYTRLVRQLADEGFETTATEVFHALLHEGPRDTSEARALIRRWRATRHGGSGAS